MQSAEALHQSSGSKHLGHRPGLERTTSCGMRWITVRRLRYRAEPELVQVRFDTVEQTCRVDADADRGLDVGSEQPGPHGSLVVGQVAFDRPTAVMRPIGRVVGCQGPEPQRGDQCGARYDHGRIIDRAVRQRDRQQLIRSDGSVVTEWAIHDVEQSAVGSDESVLERLGRRLAEPRRFDHDASRPSLRAGPVRRVR